MFSDDKWMDKVEDGWNEQGVRLMFDNLKGHGALARVALKANRAVLAHLDQNIEDRYDNSDILIRNLTESPFIVSFMLIRSTHSIQKKSMETRSLGDSSPAGFSS